MQGPSSGMAAFEEATLGVTLLVMGLSFLTQDLIYDRRPKTDFVDCNLNGHPDVQDLVDGTSLDMDGVWCTR